MSEDNFFLILYLSIGLACFFLARYTWNLSYGCKPITIGTLVAALLWMWIPPITFLGAITWYGYWLFEDGGHSWGVSVMDLLKKPVANPCKWQITKRTKLPKELIEFFFSTGLTENVQYYQIKEEYAAYFNKKKMYVIATRNGKFDIDYTDQTSGTYDDLYFLEIFKKQVGKSEKVYPLKSR